MLQPQKNGCLLSSFLLFVGVYYFISIKILPRTEKSYRQREKTTPFPTRPVFLTPDRTDPRFKQNIAPWTESGRGCTVRSGNPRRSGMPRSSLISTSPSPHYNDTVLYFKTIFDKSQPPQYPRHLGGYLKKQGHHKTSPLLTMTSCYILKQISTKANLLDSPNTWGVGLSHKPDYHKTLTSTFPLTIMWCYISKRSFTNVNLLNSPNSWGGGYLTNRTTTKLHLPSLQWCRATF